MASVLDIVRGISQAAANAYDGSQDEKYSLDGEARKIGLKREEGDPIIDSCYPGFNVHERTNPHYHKATLSLKMFMQEILKRTVNR